VPAVRETGEENVAVCQPELVSLVKVTRPKSAPVLVQRLPRCCPPFGAAL
jgi:hypothetical protein